MRFIAGFSIPVLIALPIASVILIQGEEVLRQQKVLEYQDQCMSFRMLPQARTGQYNSPDCWRRMAAIVDSAYSDADELLFLHERRTPAGEVRLVAVIHEYQREGVRTLVIKPGRLNSPPRLVCAQRWKLGRVYLCGGRDWPPLWGQPNDQDGARFTFECGNVTFDGALGSDNSVTISHPDGMYMATVVP